MGIKYVLIIQCDIARQRCSGFACTDSFYNRAGFFKDCGYAHGVRYIALTCGGCCGAEVAAKLENLTKHLKRRGERKEDVIVHFASCVCSDNYHRPPCPHLDYMRQIAERKGYSVVLGSYISNAATKKREAGIYKTF